MKSKLIVSFENLIPYTIYDNGDIINNRTGKKLTQSVGKKGGLKCSLYFKDGSKKSITVAHLMLSEFCGIKYEPNKSVTYNDGNKFNLSVANLSYVVFAPTRVYEKPNKIDGALRYCKCCGYKAETTAQLQEFVTSMECDYNKANLCKSCKQAKRRDDKYGCGLFSMLTEKGRYMLVGDGNGSYYKRNKQKILNRVREYTKNNRAKCNALAKKYKAAKLQRTPKWLTEEDFWLMEQAYIVAEERTKKYGIQFHVDHIIPLQGKHISGFHCPENLQVIPWYENISKSNKYEVAA